MIRLFRKVRRAWRQRKRERAHEALRQKRAHARLTLNERLAAWLGQGPRRRRGQALDLPDFPPASLVRRLPYPFASAVSIVSDVDGSWRNPYEAYVGALVTDLGLDFGDSVWLRWTTLRRQDTGLYGGAGGFFSRYFGIGRNESPTLYETTRTLLENVSEFHNGNVDHFHSFLSRGPRVFLIDKFNVENAGITATLSSFEEGGFYRCEDSYAFGICVVSKPGKTVRVASLRVIEQDGTVTDDYRGAAFDPPPNGRDYRLFTLFAPAESDRPLPPIDQVAKVSVDFESAEDAANVEFLLLVNASGEVVLDRLKFLRERYNVEMALVTEHAGVHFRSAARAEQFDKRMQEKLESTAGEPLLALNGNLNDSSGELIFSTEADDSHSLVRVLPDILGDLEARFLVPEAATQTGGWDPRAVVAPARSRGGVDFYWAQRCLPDMGEATPGGRTERTKSHGDNFAQRVTTMLREENGEGLYWPLYTHLGGRRATRTRKREAAQRDDDDGVDLSAVSKQYFDMRPLHELQDRVFNMSGKAEPRQRLWFARASVLYDHALMIRSLAGHVSRDAHTIEIASWHDATLKKQLPRSPAQLYGLTFYVDDPAMARVRLDGREIETLTRNPPDQTGRPSVTIAESEIRTVLFDQLDPAANQPAELKLDGGVWTWQAETTRPHGTLGSRGDAAASLYLPLHGLAGIGAQHLSLALRRQGSGQFALLLETQSGGRFFFGDEALVASAGAVTASYLFKRHDRSPGQWQSLVAAFHDLKWSPDARPGGPLPSHPLTGLTIFCKDGSIDIGNVALLRPRATALSQRAEPRFCLGGSIPGFTFGQTVQAVAADGRQAALTETVDQRGYFCFAGLPRGIYRVWSVSGGEELHDRRGALVELGGDVMYLRLERRSPRG